ncbi:hypothetical protein BDF19DRAFT_46871 [Syncephalis fuscata]|nr:hypothetical protein BDF19DRAFT_46871 [Syncephalis fuscata]
MVAQFYQLWRFRKLSEGCSIMNGRLVMLLFAILIVTMTTPIKAEMINSSIFVPCSSNSILSVETLSYNYDTSSDSISISVSGIANEDLTGFDGKHNGRVELAMQSFGGLEQTVSLGATCDLFSQCPNGRGPAIPKGAWSLVKNDISLATPIPWIDYNITFRMPVESGKGNYVCATIPITQKNAAYNKLAGQISAAFPPLALAAGVLDSYLGHEYSLLTFVMGDGSSFRLPGFFDLWEHAQWVTMTGMLGAHYTGPYESFVSGFGWSFFNWNIPFIDSIAGKSIAQPDLPSVTSSSVIGNSNAGSTAKASTNGATVAHLVARQTLPACSPSNAGPAGSCQDSAHCCSISGYCGTGASYCGPGSGPARNSQQSPSSSTTPSSANSPKAPTNINGSDSINQNGPASDNEALPYSSSRSGIAAYANSLSIAVDRLVHVTFYTFIMVIVIFLILAGFGILIYERVHEYRGVSAKTWPKISVIIDAAIGILLRIVILAFVPLLLTSIHYLALPSPSQFGTGGVAIGSVVVMILVCGPIYLLFLLFTRHSPTALFESSAYLLRMGPLFNTFVAGRIHYAVVPIARRMAYAIIIGAGQKSGILVPRHLAINWQLVMVCSAPLVGYLSFRYYLPYR